MRPRLRAIAISAPCGEAAFGRAGRAADSAATGTEARGAHADCQRRLVHAFARAGNSASRQAAVQYFEPAAFFGLPAASVPSPQVGEEIGHHQGAMSASGSGVASSLT